MHYVLLLPTIKPTIPATKTISTVTRVRIKLSSFRFRFSIASLLALRYFLLRLIGNSGDIRFKNSFSHAFLLANTLNSPVETCFAFSSNSLGEVSTVPKYVDFWKTSTSPWISARKAWRRSFSSLAWNRYVFLPLLGNWMTNVQFGVELRIGQRNANLASLVALSCSSSHSLNLTKSMCLLKPLFFARCIERE